MSIAIPKQRKPWYEFLILNDSFEIFKEGPKSETFRIITKEDLRKYGKFPKNKY